MSFDLSASLRRLKPERISAALERRCDEDLPFVRQPLAAGAPLLFDTTVYIDVLQDRVPDEVADLIRVRQCNHSSVAVAEFAYMFGRLDPRHTDTAHAWASARQAIDDIPAHRLSAPSIRAAIEASILGGIVARVRGLPRSSKQPLLNDAALLFQAHEEGCCLLSRNIVDLDFLLQVFPAGRVLLYRQTA